jgi:hypothetical protein
MFIVLTAPSVIAMAIEEEKGKESVCEFADGSIRALCRCIIALNTSNMQSTSNGFPRDDWLHLQILQNFHQGVSEIRL